MNALFIVSFLGVAAMLSEIFNFKKLLPYLVLIGLGVAIGVGINEWNHPVNFPLFKNMLVFNQYAIAFTVVLIVIGLLWFMLSQKYFENTTGLTDHYALALFSLAGAIIMTAFGNLTMLFLGIEILSIPLYVLAGSRKNDLASNESAFKYFLMGAFASAFLLFGIALVYGATASFDLEEIGNYVLTNGANLPSFFIAGILLIIVGLAFKISAAPFHFWAPDVYQGAPNVITAFMSTIVKTAAFAAFFRLFSVCFISIDGVWTNALFVIAAITLLLGNITAVSQTSFKRMLAYSSISHAGYLLMAIIAMGNGSMVAILFYTLSYSIATILAFVVLNYVYVLNKNDNIESFNGLAKRNRLLAFGLTVAMLSLAGIPPTAGFFAKYSIFSTALAKGQLTIVIVAIIASMIGIYYYLKPVIAAYFKESKDEDAIAMTHQHKFLLIISIIAIIILGVLPSLVLNIFN